MTPLQVLNYYAGPPTDKGGRVKITADKLKITPQAIYKWLRDGEIPRGRQLELQEQTGGKLRADKPKRSRK